MAPQIHLNGFIASRRYTIYNDDQLKKLIGCDSIDYIMIHNCRTCTQETWAKISIKKITDNRPGHIEPSVDLWECPKITNMAALKNVESIPSGIVIERMPGMVSLEGAHRIHNFRSSVQLHAFARCACARARARGWPLLVVCLRANVFEPGKGVHLNNTQMLLE